MSVGTGRYTKYVPQEPRSKAIYDKIKGLFNNQSSQADVGSVYAGDDLTTVATGIRTNYANLSGDFDPETWSTNPRKDPAATVPDLTSVSRASAPTAAKAGFPANPYMPDLRSPGSSGGPGSDNWSLPDSGDDALSASSYKPNLTIGSGGTANPSANVIANPIVAATPVLVKGSSTKKS